MDDDDEAIERWRAHRLRQAAARHRSRMRWWRHAREYLSLKRLVLQGLLRPPIPDHPPWSQTPNHWEKPGRARRP